jgi:hypothetical protein
MVARDPGIPEFAENEQMFEEGAFGTVWRIVCFFERFQAGPSPRV